MRYRCTACGNKCTISVKKGTLLMRCPVDDRDALWIEESKAPSDDARGSRIRKNMISDAKGFYIRAIDPMNRHVDLVYRSIGEAAIDLKVPKGSISRAVKSSGRLKAGPYYWKREMLTFEQMEIKKAAQNGIEAYRTALKEYDPMRYLEVFGEGDE